MLSLVLSHTPQVVFLTIVFYIRIRDRLFMLRRGPLLGPILQHPDDIDSVRCLFLQSKFECCKQLIEPALLAVTPAGFVELPLETLALQSNFILYLDHVTDVFVWVGKQAKESAQSEQLRQTCVQLFQHQTAHRFPSPYFMSFNEGDSMSRWLLCRLVPSHKDPPEIQEKLFPSIKLLGEQQRRALVSKFHYTDDLSYYQYYLEYIDEKAQFWSQ